MFFQLVAVINRIPDLLDDALTFVVQKISQFARQAFIRLSRFAWKSSVVLTILFSLFLVLSIFHELTFLPLGRTLHVGAWALTALWLGVILAGVI